MSYRANREKNSDENKTVRRYRAESDNFYDVFRKQRKYC